MREMLFRGKRIDGKEWVGGYFANIGEKSVIILEEEKYSFNMKMSRMVKGHDLILVDPETVCQYTGLTDKNGRKIFEGDILEVCTFGFNPERFITEVIYEKCAFRLKNGRNMFYCGQSDFTKMDDAKVIGNIFDNPELIGDQP